jgi:DeoR family fructose operon transcriptional repressor
VLKENKEAKLKIAKKAASLIKDGDFVFIDSGTTCYYLIDFINAKNVTVVTNGIIHIQKLFEKGMSTYILGGYANLEENLILGEDTVNKISRMNFNISFIGTMGIDSVGGFTTFASFDGEIKKAVIKSSQACYVLADTSKFNVRRFYSYGELSEAAVITNSMVDFDSDKLNIIYTDK